MKAITTIVLLLTVSPLVIGCEEIGPVATNEDKFITATASPTHAIDLACFAGPCAGTVGQVNVTTNSRPVANAAPGFGFAVEGVFTIHGAPPGTTYIVQRRVDFAIDGICSGATYVSFPIPTPGPLVLLTTSAAGAGAAHFDNQLPPFADDSRFDVTFRLIEDSPNPGGTDIRTGCVTVTVK
jgi:hypothetical protein